MHAREARGLQSLCPPAHPLVRRQQDAEAKGAAGGSLIEGLDGDLSLKAGERITIKVNVNGAAAGGAKGSAAAKPAGAAPTGGLLAGGKLRPPTSSGLRPLPAAAAPAGAGSDLGMLGAGVAGLSFGGAPAAAPAPAQADSDWVTF